MFGGRLEDRQATRGPERVRRLRLGLCGAIKSPRAIAAAPPPSPPRAPTPTRINECDAIQKALRVRQIPPSRPMAPPLVPPLGLDPKGPPLRWARSPS